MKSLYHDMLKDEIWEFVSMSTCKTLDDMIGWAREQDIDQETQTKRKSVQVQISQGSGNKPKVVDSR